MARGGSRQGQPGKTYSNRTDLNTNRAPQTPQVTAAGGPTAPPPQQGPAFMSPDMVPKLDDPTGRPNEPLTTGLSTGPGMGPEAIGGSPPNPAVASVQAAYLANPTPQLRRALMSLTARGAL